MTKTHEEVVLEDQLVYCANPDCLGEPWCSLWGICKSGTETNRVALDSEAEFVQASIPAPPLTIIRTQFHVNLHLQRATFKLSDLRKVAFPPKLNMTPNIASVCGKPGTNTELKSVVKKNQTQDCRPS